jgi:CelD/BcsL family acetyltransferase involved in cellulose biosynthesis
MILSKQALPVVDNWLDSFQTNDSEEFIASQNDRVDLIETEQAFNAMRDAWTKLNDSALKGSVFTSWEWLNTWWKTYKSDGNRQLYILKYTNQNGDLLGLAPFQLVYNPKKYFPCSTQLIMIGTGETEGSAIFGENMDLMIASGHETVVIKAFSQFLNTNKPSWNGMKFHQILGSSHLSQLLKTLSNISTNSLMKEQADGIRTLLELPEIYEDYLMGLNKKVRNNIRRRFKKLEREQNYSLETIKSVSECDNALDILADLNCARRDDLGGEPSVFEDNNFLSFHRKITKLILSCKEKNKQSTTDISLSILRFDGVPVAALYLFIDGDTIHGYQSGFERENGRRYALMTTMIALEISKSINNKTLKYFNFMYSEDESSYKKQYAGNNETMYSLSLDHDGIKYQAYSFIQSTLKKKLKKLLKKVPISFR